LSSVKTRALLQKCSLWPPLHFTNIEFFRSKAYKTSRATERSNFLVQKSYWPLMECTSSGMEVKSQIQIKTTCSQFCHLPGFWATTHLLLRHPPAFFPPNLPLSHTCKAKKVSISKTNWLKRLWFCSLLLYYDLHSKWEILKWPYFLACMNHPCDYCS
jgi:hypothetical protein